MSETDIQMLFWRRRRPGYLLIVPNYTPAGWHECDLWCVTKAGYAHEFEIKRTPADFKADWKKRAASTPCYNKTEDGRTRFEWTPGALKLDRLENDRESGPTEFSYIVPEGMLVSSEVPEVAGLIYVLGKGWKRLQRIKPAVRRHSNPVSLEQVQKAQAVFYWRFWAERQKRLGLARKGNST